MGNCAKCSERFGLFSDKYNSETVYNMGFDKNLTLNDIYPDNPYRGMYLCKKCYREVYESFVSKKVRMNKNDVIVPLGVTFKFAVTPSVSTYHQQGLKHYIINESILRQYYKNIDVSFYDGCYSNKDGLSITDNSLKGKQMQVKVFCPEPIVEIDKNKEEDFYKQVKEKVSEWIIGLIQSNQEIKYSAKIESFLYVQRMM
jgi:hypothetical protein